jgi:hypothetical protein
MQVKDIVDNAVFWEDLQRGIQLYQPFSDYIHQLEGDSPGLGRVYRGLMQLDQHVRASVEQWRSIPRIAGSCDTVLKTWERRLGNCNSTGCTVQPLLQPPHIAAYLLDPLYAELSAGPAPAPPTVATAHEAAARTLIERVGGRKAAKEFDKFMLQGYIDGMCNGAKVCAETLSDTAAQPGSKRKRQEFAAVAMRKSVCRRYGQKTASGSPLYPELSKVACRLLSLHPTSCAAERNWSLWGRVYTASRNSLGLERAKKIIMFCFNHRAQHASTEDFDLMLSIVENTLT